ncbi:hypothetical protein ACQEVS_33010 [Streptomyces sp. CA-181903]|uniref:hypothetical protein n=1 Tax=Streptomyces sp. CA-181903 TaxID=3240055 RepID=UPI003D8EE115
MSTAGSGPYDWAKDKGWGPSQPPSQPSAPRRAGAAPGAANGRARSASSGSGASSNFILDGAGRWVGVPSGTSGRDRTTNRTNTKSKTYNINVGGAGAAGSGGGRGGSSGGGAGAASSAAGADRHQGDQLIHQIERIEFRGTSDIQALARAINHLGRELHLILGMRAEELNGVLSTYRGKWYTFGASSKVRARLVSAHLKVSAEAAKALGVGALKMAHAYNRHFVQPEQEARRQRGQGAKKPRTFSVVEED